MTISYEDIDAGRTSVFPPTVELDDGEPELLFSVLDRVARAAGHDAASGRSGARVAAAGADFRRQIERGRPVAVDAVLDLAAELLEVSDELVASGLDLEALALEGVSGRLVERIVGVGPVEGTPLAGGR